MAENPRLSLWLKPEGKTYELLSEIIRDLAGKFGSPVFEPHVTLLDGFKEPVDSILEVLDTLSDIVTPIEIQLGRIGYKDNRYQSFFAHVENEPILTLRKRFEEAFSKSGNEAYMPHLSLMYHIMPKKEKVALANELGGSVDMKFVAQTIHVVSTAGEPEEWKEIAVRSFSG